MSRIAFIGLGNMGGPMAANLAKAGHAVRVFDLVPAAVQAAINGETVTDGMDLGLSGYNAIKLDGKVIYGQAWVNVNKDNMADYPF